MTSGEENSLFDIDSFSKSIAASHLTTLQFCPARHNFLCKDCAIFWFPPSSSDLCLPFPLHLTSAKMMHQFASVISYTRVRKLASLEVIQHLLELVLEIKLLFVNVFLCPCSSYCDIQIFEYLIL